MFAPDVPATQLASRKRASLATLALAAPLSLTACMGSAPPAPQVVTMGAVAYAPRSYTVVRGATQLSITDTPGTLIDDTAPPPSPGQTPTPHPFLSGSCGGDALGCSQARTILEQSSSISDFFARLTAAGFAVNPRD